MEKAVPDYFPMAYHAQFEQWIAAPLHDVFRLLCQSTKFAANHARLAGCED